MTFRRDFFIFLGSLVLGAVFWLIHSLLHWHFFYGGDFWKILAGHVPVHDLVVRFSGVAIMVVIGTVHVLIRRRWQRGKLQSEALFTSVFTASPVGMALVNKRTRRFQRVNPSLENILGYPGEMLRRMGIDEVMHPDDPLLEFPPDRQLPYDTKARREYPKRILGKDGTEKQVLLRIETLPVFRDADFPSVLLVLTDITENLRTLERLKLSERRFRVMAETVPLGIQEIDIQGRIQWVNPAYCRMFKCSFSDAVSTFIWDRLPDPRPLRELYARLMREQPAPKLWTGKNIVDESTSMDVRVEWDYRRDVEGMVTGAVAVIADVTEEKRMQIQLYQARRMEAVGRLAGGVAHDLNNMLTPIMGYAELLRDEFDTGDSRREAVEEIHLAGSRSRDLVGQLLAFGRRQALEFSRLDLNKVVKGMQRILRRTIRENIRFHVHLDQRPLVVRADSLQVEQVLTNLAVNAQDAMADGGDLTLETGRVELDEAYIRTHPVVKPGHYALLAVSDTGSGMDEETRERVFDPFFTTKEEGDNIGLGLATIYGVVKQHEGYIWAYSEPGIGSTFKVYLPLCRDESAVVTEPQKEENAIGKELQGSERIMVVEDDTMVRRLAEGMLRRLGYRVETAASGEECLAKLSSTTESLDLLLSDVVMPGLNGSELYAKLREIQPGLKVIFMSGYTDNVVNRNRLWEEKAGFLQKPFSLKSLAEGIRAALNNQPHPDDKP